MLKKLRKVRQSVNGGKFAIVASRYNAEYVDAMLHEAREELLRAGAHVRIVRVPGAFEIPAVAAKLANRGRYAAIICLGVIFQGQTSHAQQISTGVTLPMPLEHKVQIVEVRKA